MGHAIDTYTFYADMPKTFFVIHRVYQLGIVCGPIESISFVVVCEPMKFISSGYFCGTIEVYQLLNLCVLLNFCKLVGFFANPRARGPEIPACRLDCHVLIGLSRSLSVETGLVDIKNG